MMKDKIDCYTGNLLDFDMDKCRILPAVQSFEQEAGDK